VSRSCRQRYIEEESKVVIEYIRYAVELDEGDQFVAAYRRAARCSRRILTVWALTWRRAWKSRSTS